MGGPERGGKRRLGKGKKPECNRESLWAAKEGGTDLHDQKVGKLRLGVCPQGGGKKVQQKKAVRKDNTSGQEKKKKAV